MNPASSGHHGWDEYAPFYDWENARTFGRRDVAFWQRIVSERAGRVLELGCGTGRLTIPLARAGTGLVVGIDRSAPMLERGRRRLKRSRNLGPVSVLRGDIRDLPFKRGAFGTVIAPYGMLQSLLRDRDLDQTLESVWRVLAGRGESRHGLRDTENAPSPFETRRETGAFRLPPCLPGQRASVPRSPCGFSHGLRGARGVFGVELVADLPGWQEYERRISLRGRRGRTGKPITLIESVRQDAEKGLTFFDQEFVEGRGRSATRHQFTLTFRTVSVPDMARRLERAGFEVTATFGDYQGGPWDRRAEVWILLARKVARQLASRRRQAP